MTVARGKRARTKRTRVVRGGESPRHAAVRRGLRGGIDRAAEVRGRPISACATTSRGTVWWALLGLVATHSPSVTSDTSRHRGWSRSCRQASVGARLGLTTEPWLRERNGTDGYETVGVALDIASRTTCATMLGRVAPRRGGNGPRVVACLANHVLLLRNSLAVRSLREADEGHRLDDHLSGLARSHLPSPWSYR